MKVEKLEQLSEHILETAGPDAEILQVSDSHLLDTDCLSAMQLNIVLIQDIYDRIDRMDPATFEVRATEILMGLGFSTVRSSSLKPLCIACVWLS